MTSAEHQGDPAAGTTADAVLSLTPAQLGMWFAETLSEEYSVNIAQYLDIRYTPGELDHELLARCNEETGKVVESPYLRLVETAGVPGQIIDVEYDQHVDIIDLRSHDDPVTAAQQWMRDDYMRTIDLMTDQLIVSVLLRVADGRTFWYTRGHHLIIDGFGAMTLLRMAVDRYNAARRGTTLAEKPVATMAEIVADAERYRASSRRQTDGEHWREVMANLPERVTLSRRPTAKGLSPQNVVASATLSPEFQARLELTASRLGSSMAMILAAAYGAFLYRMTGNDDVLVSLPVTGRTTAKIKRAGGMLSNVLPVRMSGLSRTTVAELVRSVQVEMTGALRHQMYRSDDIRRDAGLEMDAVGFGPTINMVFFDSAIEIVDADVDYRILSSGLLEDLLVNLYQASPGAALLIDLHGNPFRYDQAEIDSHHQRFMAFIDAFIADTDAPISSVPLLLPGEESSIAAVEAGVAAATEGGAYLLAAFERQVTATPDATALITGERTISYREFAARVAVVARQLLDDGVGPEVAVAISGPRSVEMLVALYAVVAAGGHCVPIPGGTPSYRVEYMLAIADARLMLVHDRHVDDDALTAAQRRGLLVHRIDSTTAVDPEAAPVTPTERGVLHRDSPVCTVFTPGSTGMPKGVVLGHGAVLNRLAWLLAEQGVAATDVVLSATRHTPDCSTPELFAPLMVGAALVLTDESFDVDAKSLAAEVTRVGATSLYIAPEILANLVTLSNAKSPGAVMPSVRVISSTGSPLPVELVTDVRRIWPTLELYNLYGAAEAAGEITYERIGQSNPEELTVPIGVPVWNSSAMILDDRLQRVPAGVPGELYLAGPQIARGYAGRPGLTARRFVANPFASEGERLYRTGDVVFRLPDGRIEYLDRLDHHELQFWADELAGLDQFEYVSTDRSRPLTASGAVSVVEREIPTESVAAMTQCAARLRATPQVVVHAALCVLLARVSGESDIAVGAAVAGHSAAELIGLVANAVVIRTEVAHAARLSDVVVAVRDAAHRALSHAEIPFEQVAETVAPGHSRGHIPLVQVMVSWQRLGPGDSTAESTQPRGARALPIDRDIDIAFTEVDAGDGPVVRIALGYSSDLFDKETIDTVADGFMRILHALIADPEASVAAVDLMSAERVRELTGPSRTVEPWTFRALVLDLESRPDRSTVAISGAGRVERTAFEARTNQIARELIGRGVGPGDVVAIAIGRSADSVVATFAVVKTGAAFVSIDPRYPADRQKLMLTDSGARLGLYSSAAGSSGADMWPDITWIDVNPVVDRQFAATPIGDHELVRLPDIDDLAYLIYTSGSTGLPKAAAISHRGLRNFTVNQLDKFGLTSADKVLHVSSPSFDAALMELLSAVGSGAELVVAPAMVYAGDELAALIADNGATHAFLTPSVLETVDPANVPTLRTVICGGEAMPQELADRWAGSVARTSKRRFLNAYGPTENTIFSTWAELAGPDTPITIGEPLVGVIGYVLDSCLRPAPDGVPGHLYLGGPQLGLGYHNRPGLTSTSFVANPYAGGERMYATGDRVVRDRAGRLVFAGRLDFQLKIRGQRVEPGEVDGVLERHRDVITAVTIGINGAGGQALLVSYAQTRPDALVTADELLLHAADRLPSHMVPHRLVLIEKFTLTPVGKIDRKALPAVDVSATAEFVAPRTEHEEVVATVFAEILGTERISVDVGFFEAGGNSLAAVKLASALSEATGRPISLKTLLESSSVEAIAAYVEHSVGDAHQFELMPQIRPDVIPVSEVQRGMWLLNRTDPDSPAYNIAFALRLSGDLDPKTLQIAVADLVERQVALRTYYPMVGGDPTQRVVPAADVLATIDLEPADAVESPLAAVAAIVSRGFDVTTEPPFRMALLRTGEREHIVVFVIHHISADGSSLKPLAQDFLAAARARADGLVPQFAPLRVDYPGFTLWQGARLAALTEGGVTERERQLAYWRSRLAGAPEQLNLPADRPRRPTPTFEGATVEFDVPEALVRRLEAVARSRNATLFDVVHGAYAVFLGRMAGVSDVVIGTAFAGRIVPELDDLVGMFVNSLPLRTQLRPGEAFHDLVGRVHMEDMEDMANADVAFESIVEAVGIRRSSAVNPVFQAMLLFQNFEFPVVELPGLTISLVDDAPTPAQVDLQLTMFPKDPLRLGAKVSGSPIQAAFVYSTDLFDAGTIERYGERFLAVLEAVADDPAVRVADVSISTDADARPPTGDPDSRLMSLPDFVADRAAAEPGRVAVRHGEAAVTFADLSMLTTVLAASLPDADSALVAALMSLLPDLGSAGPLALGEALSSIRRIDA